MQCLFEECEREKYSLGYCRTHYIQRRNGKPLTPIRVLMPSETLCIVPGCSRYFRCKGLCESHYNLARNHKLTPEELIEVVASKVCDICKVKEPRDVDHDHVTGKVRGFLCRACNLSLGTAQESPELLRRMASYLEEHKNV